MVKSVLKDIESVEVFKYFEEISQISRGSGNEKEISDYLVKFAKKYNLYFIQDEALNVIIKKKATPGYENAPIVVLQGHMDMVCEKNEYTIHDFEKDTLKLKIVGDMIYATGTTLGADDGIGVAMELALLASNEIPHPAIEAIFTTDEERGMVGAMKIDSKNIEGRILINIDSSEEGVFIVGCAGGPTVRTSISLTWNDANGKLIPYVIKIKGLKGGHSGEDIHRGRANAIKLMIRILMSLESEIEFNIASINGGVKYNAIPRESSCMILIKSEDKIKADKKIKEMKSSFENEFRISDANLKVESEVVEEQIKKVFSKDSKNRVMEYLYLVENGVNTMSMDVQGLVESSVSIGVIKTKNDEVEFLSLIRSSIRSLYIYMFQKLKILAKVLGAEIEIMSQCPEWEYNHDSKIKIIFEEVYNKMYGKKAKISLLHAGLECGIFDERFNGEMDMISFGPDTYELHTPEEHISISSVKRTWKFLLTVLKEIK